MERLKAITNNTVFALQILLVFLLLFEGQIRIPVWLQPVGRMHPLLLHLPIGFLILAALLPFLKREVDGKALFQIRSFILHLAALTAVLTALMGLFLAREDGYASQLVDQHKWLGAGVSFLTYGLLVLHNNFPQKQKLFNGALAVNILLLIIAGHLGASITHGEDYILAPLRNDEPVITEETPVFEAAVQPVLKAKCFSCHNERKSKGGLIMTSTEKLLEGGENGPVWFAGNAEESLVIQRLRLPPDHEEHMPPEGKPQLDEREIELLYTWIEAGADMEQKLRDLAPESPLFPLVDEVIADRAAAAGPAPRYAFKPASETTIEELNGPFRTVRPVALRSPALQAEIFVRQFYEPRFLEELKDIREQLVSLNLTNMPVRDEDLAVIAQFSNLEKLILNGTDVTGENLELLKDCARLRSLSLANTAVTADIGPALEGMPALEEVFIWNTRIDSLQTSKLREQLPGIDLQIGYVPDKEERLPLSPPRLKKKSTLLEKGEKVALENKLPGAVIRYTTDGTEPDSLRSPLYEAPFTVDGLTTVKARTYKEGWITSATSEFMFFPAGMTPDTAFLLHMPSPKYPGEGAASLFDTQKGKPDNFLGNFWLGFREEPFTALIDMGTQAPEVETIVISYLRNIFSYIMPPASVEVWGGNDPENMERLAALEPEQPSGYMSNVVSAIRMPIPASKFRYYKVIARPVAKLPQWHRGAGDKGWVFVDELFFY